MGVNSNGSFASDSHSDAVVQPVPSDDLIAALTPLSLETVDEVSFDPQMFEAKLKEAVHVEMKRIHKEWIGHIINVYEEEFEKQKAEISTEINVQKENME